MTKFQRQPTKNANLFDDNSVSNPLNVKGPVKLRLLVKSSVCMLISVCQSAYLSACLLIFLSHITCFINYKTERVGSYRKTAQIVLF